MSTETTRPHAAADAETPQDDALRQERDELRDRLLRTSADFDNYRKRTDRERRDLSAHATADLVKELLPIIDDLERAASIPLDADAGAAQVGAVRDGLAMVHRQFLDVLQRRGVEPIATVGSDFDPEWHEALSTEPANGRRDGEITAEIRRGYRMGARLLRAALVKVAQS